jgi:DnaJ-class molecular chaperone
MVIANKPTMTNKNSCHHCSGLGYIEIRDCSGEIQRSETCSFCSGTGYIEREEMELEGDRSVTMGQLSQN